AAYPMVSRKHAELRWHDGKWILVDLNTTYGTFVDERKISEPERIAAGQRMQFGQDGPVMKVVWFEALTDSQPVGIAPGGAAVNVGSAVPAPQAPPANPPRKPHVEPFVAPSPSRASHTRRT